MIQQPYHYAPTRLRVYQGFIAFCVCALVGGISAGAASGATRYVLVFVAVVVRNLTLIATQYVRRQHP
jgi:hypothetical protein